MSNLNGKQPPEQGSYTAKQGQYLAFIYYYTKIHRQPSCVVWITFGFLAFDDDGCFDLSSFDRHQRARAALALALPSVEPKSEEVIVDAANRFVAQGSCWTPSRALQRRIDAVALEQVKCARL